MVAKKYYDTLLEITEIMDEKGRGMDEKEKSGIIDTMSIRHKHKHVYQYFGG